MAVTSFGYPSGTGVFVPNHEASGNLITNFSRALDVPPRAVGGVHERHEALGAVFETERRSVRPHARQHRQDHDLAARQQCPALHLLDGGVLLLLLSV